MKISAIAALFFAGVAGVVFGQSSTSAFVRETGYPRGDGCGRTAAKWIKEADPEWEYAARAGSTSYFWWGGDESTASAHAWFKTNSGEHTHPVELKPANAFGLYDIVGNVSQWTQDCYAESYAAAAADGRANATEKDCLRVDRGGSWQHRAWLLRSATRERNPADFRAVTLGFRLARALP